VSRIEARCRSRAQSEGRLSRLQMLMIESESHLALDFLKFRFKEEST